MSNTSPTTKEIRRSMLTLAAFIADHDLTLYHVEFSPSSTAKRWDPATKDFTRPVLPEIALHHFSDLDWFLSWADALSIENARVHRRDSDILLYASIDFDGITWRVSGGESKYQQVRLPVNEVTWTRNSSGRNSNHGRISLDTIQAALLVTT